MWTSEARGVCKDRSRWRSEVSAYPHGKKAWVYVCMMLIVVRVLSLPNSKRMRYFWPPLNESPLPDQEYSTSPSLRLAQWTAQGTDTRITGGAFRPATEVSTDWCAVLTAHVVDLSKQLRLAARVARFRTLFIYSLSLYIEWTIKGDFIG